MTVLTEGKRPGQFLLSEGNFHISRDQVVVASGSGKLAAGTVLGKLTSGGKYKASTDTGADGGQTAVAVLLYGVDATSADQPAVVISRSAEVKSGELAYDASVSDATKRAAKATQLAAVGIIVR